MTETINTGNVRISEDRIFSGDSDSPERLRCEIIYMKKLIVSVQKYMGRTGQFEKQEADKKYDS